MEASLWEKGVFGSLSAQTLLDTLFFYNCKPFCMRSGDEYRDLHVEMFSFGADNNGWFLTFKGGRSKITQGSLRHGKLAFKNIKHYGKFEGDS